MCQKLLSHSLPPPLLLPLVLSHHCSSLLLINGLRTSLFLTNLSLIDSCQSDADVLGEWKPRRRSLQLQLPSSLLMPRTKQEEGERTDSTLEIEKTFRDHVESLHFTDETIEAQSD